MHNLKLKLKNNQKDLQIKQSIQKQALSIQFKIQEKLVELQYWKQNTSSSMTQKVGQSHYRFSAASQNIAT